MVNYAIGGDSIITACTAGYYCPGGGTHALLCPAGTYSPTDGSAACTTTAKGYWSAAGASVPTACPAGTYLPTTGATSAAACQACSSGYTCPSGSSVEGSCSGGTYVVGGTNCVPCTAGNYCPAGATAPVPCPRGSYSTSTSAASALDCTFAPAGSYVPSAGSTAATQCSAGSYTAVTGASGCQVCPAGTYDPTTVGRTSVCGLCPVNYYCTGGGLTETTCPAHTVSSAGASTVLSCSCVSGYSCAYSKRITATVVVNSTVTNFNADANGIKTKLIAAVAAAAGVPVGSVSINSVNPHTGGRRRRGLLQSVITMARVDLRIDGVHPLVRGADLAPALARRGLLT